MKNSDEMAVDKKQSGNQRRTCLRPALKGARLDVCCNCMQQDENETMSESDNPSTATAEQCKR
jgi:hypothetical protein